MKKLTTEIFIQRAQKVHGNKYDYSKVIYKHSTICVEIICMIHGSFMCEPRIHLSGNICPKCGIKKRNKSNTKTTKQFIQEAIEIHGNFYDYSKVIYQS